MKRTCSTPSRNLIKAIGVYGLYGQISEGTEQVRFRASNSTGTGKDRVGLPLKYKPV